MVNLRDIIVFLLNWTPSLDFTLAPPITILIKTTPPSSWTIACLKHMANRAVSIHRTIGAEDGTGLQKHTPEKLLNIRW